MSSRFLWGDNSWSRRPPNQLSPHINTSYFFTSANLLLLNTTQRMPRVKMQVDYRNLFWRRQDPFGLYENLQVGKLSWLVRLQVPATSHSCILLRLNSVASLLSNLSLLGRYVVKNLIQRLDVNKSNTSVSIIPKVQNSFATFSHLHTQESVWRGRGRGTGRGAQGPHILCYQSY